MNKVCYLRTRNIFGFKKNEILTPATTWVNFEDIMLSEISRKCVMATIVLVKNRE